MNEQGTVALIAANGPPAAPDSLELMQRAATALAEARSIDDVKAIRDQAAAALVYARKRDLGDRLIADASEIKLRAERRLGEMLAEVIPHGGGRPPKLSCDTTVVRLDDLGVSRDESSRYQRIASLPEEAFEGYVQESLAAEAAPTAAGLLRASKPKKDEPPDLRTARERADERQARKISGEGKDDETWKNKELPVEERIEAWNQHIESVATTIRKAAERLSKFGPLSSSHVDTIYADARSLADLIRRAKCSQACKSCNGSGCSHCTHCGMITKRQADTSKL